MKRPSIDEYDTGSYLDGSAMPHEVIQIIDGVLMADTSPFYGFSEINVADQLCQEHAFELLRASSFSGPIEVKVSYNGHGVDTELAMVKLDPIGGIEYVAEYAYGRAYFEPGEPRTKPCSVCGVETLISAGGYEDEEEST